MFFPSETLTKVMYVTESLTGYVDKSRIETMVNATSKVTAIHYLGYDIYRANDEDDSKVCFII